MARKQERRRGFGVLLGDLQDSYGFKGQRELAAFLHVSRPLVGNVLTGYRPPSKDFLTLLASKFPDRSDEITAVGQLYQKPRKGRRRSIAPLPLQQKITQLITSGNLHEARDILGHWLSTSQADGRALWALETLSAVEHQLGDSQASGAYRLFAIWQAERENTDAVANLWEQQALDDYSEDRLDAAVGTLDMALSGHPKAPLLWQRKATLHWEAGELANAYAALEAALAHKGSRLDALSLRARILLQWKLFDQALADLDELMTDAQRLPPMQRADIESGRAYGRCLVLMPRQQLALPHKLCVDTSQPDDWGAQVSRLREALEQAVNAAPDNPWPAYYGAMSSLAWYGELCLANGAKVQGDIEEMAEDAQIRAMWYLEHVLRGTNPPPGRYLTEQAKELWHSVSQRLREQHYLRKVLER